MTFITQSAPELAMPFVFNRETRAVVDKEQNISISLGVGLWADTEPKIFKFEYISPEACFNFGFLSQSERRKFIRDGKEVEWLVNTAIEIYDPTIRSGLANGKVKPAQPLNSKQYEDLKATIKAGVYALCVPRDLKDGSILVPDFKVSFIDDVKFKRDSKMPTQQSSP